MSNLCGTVLIIIIIIIIIIINYTSTYVRKQGYNWTKKRWHEHVPKSVETIKEAR